MMTHLIKIRYLFSPMFMIIISVMGYKLLLPSLEQSRGHDTVLALFCCFVVYWLTALIFNIYGFIKNRP